MESPAAVESRKAAAIKSLDVAVKDLTDLSHNFGKEIKVEDVRELNNAINYISNIKLTIKRIKSMGKDEDDFEFEPLPSAKFWKPQEPFRR